ncbi:MAG: alanine racemase [Actinobacteria bacterium HGW-Actinobacteria-2]|nr:MAG: alanine racemase [Actinobacteria bacterium HGW-Actinobacteria-2]
MIEPTNLATVRLDRIAANLAAIRSRVEGRKVLVAVKADAYGHGAVEIAAMIEKTGAADWLGVATVDEALELREAGIKLPILKLSMARNPGEIDAAVAAGITLTVTDVESINAVAAAAASNRVVADVHLKVDTGMRRIGCPPEQAVDLAKLVDAASSLHLGGVFSHLPISDSPAGAEFTAAQIALFAQTVAAVEAARGPVPLKHLANSGGILAHPDSWFDLVRAGIIVYGAYPDPEVARTVPLKPALEWRSYLSFVKPVAAGETVSYGRTWTAERDTVVGTVPVGYADGYSRLLSNRGRMLIDGRSCPVIGRVCMDQTMVDLGPDATDLVGDEVVLIGVDGGEEITTTEIATLMGTIPYEVTCLLTARVAREFVG